MHDRSDEGLAAAIASHMQVFGANIAGIQIAHTAPHRTDLSNRCRPFFAIAPYPGNGSSRIFQRS